MQLYSLASLALALALLAALIFLMLYVRAERRAQATAMEAARLGAEAAALEGLHAEIEAERGRLAEMAEQIRQSVRAQTEAETRLNEAEKAMAQLREDHTKALSKRDDAIRGRQEAEKQAALAQQELEGMRLRMADWEKAKAESVEAAKAAALASVSEMSNKLIADHKRETEESRKKGEEQVRKATEGLAGQFEKITRTVTSLHQQVGETRGTVDTVYRALSSPGGAGRYAEIGLENLLKRMGLEDGRDFRVQHSVSGHGERGNLRPDAVIFLPNNSVMVIDSKASKFLLELAEAEEAEDTEKKDDAHANLARTMNQHLKALTSKDYRGAILEDHKRSGRAGNLGRVISVMYLPNDGALEKVKVADREFPYKAIKADIILAGPTGLTSLIGFASMEIGLARQDENRDRIIEQTAALLDSVNVLLGHADQVGKGIKRAADHFRKFSSSVNSRLLPRARGLISLGLQPGAAKEMHGNLPTYEVLATEDADVIDGEAEQIPARGELQDLSKRG